MDPLKAELSQQIMEIPSEKPDAGSFPGLF